MLPGIPGSAMCVQGFDDSLNSAIHTTYRISLRPSSLRLPRHPWFAIVKVVFLVKATTEAAAFWFRNNWLLFKRCLIKIVPQRRGGTRQIRLCATESPAGLNIHLCRMMATKRIVRFAVGKLTPRDPGTIRTGSDAHTEVNGTASYKPGRLQKNAHLI